MLDTADDFDLFISYSRRENSRGQVTALKEEIESSYREFAGRDLRVFFDTQAIEGMVDWRHKIQRALRSSSLFLAILSPDYIASPFCRWEWEEYVRYEAMRQCLGDGVAPVYFLTLPDEADPAADQSIARWIAEIRQRQAFDLRAWYESGEKELREQHARTALAQLQSSLRNRFKRTRQAARSPSNLPRHNPWFVGRGRELASLRDALAQNKLSLVGTGAKSAGLATVQGLGGMGKTELALAYAHAFAWDYPGGRWHLAVEHESDLRRALMRLAGPWRLELTDDERKDVALGFERVLAALKARGRCLLLPDNVSDPELFAPEHLDRLPRDGSVDLLATTRLASAQIPGSAQDQRFVAVDELPEEDAMALLRSHQPEGRFASAEEEQWAEKIVELLGRFTLAVETAGIYLGRNPGPEACASFHGRLRRDLLGGSDGAAANPAVAVRHRERLLEKTLAFTLDSLSTDELQVLSFASLLPADQIPVPWLEALADLWMLDTNEVLDLLLGQRLLQSTEALGPDGRPLVVRMHRLVQKIVRAGQPRDVLEQAWAAISALVWARVDALHEVTHWPAARWELAPLEALALVWSAPDEIGLLGGQASLIDHSVALYAQTSHPKAATLLAAVGGFWHEVAEDVRAERLLRRALALHQNGFAIDDAKLAQVLTALGTILQDMRRMKEAEECQQSAIALLRRVGASARGLLGAALNKVAILLISTGRTAEAEPLLREALAIVEEKYGTGDHRLATPLATLARLFLADQRYGEAEPLLRRVIAVEEGQFGPRHPKVASGLNNLASALSAAGRPGEAAPLMRRALEILSGHYGEDHPLVATQAGNLASALQALGQFGEAETLFRQALALDEGRCGPEHPDVARSLNNLAGLLIESKRLLEAEPLLRRALRIDLNAPEQNHRDSGTDFVNLGHVLQYTGRQAEAEEALRLGLQGLGLALGHDHPAVASAAHNLGILIEEMGRREEAEPYMRQNMTILLRHLKATGYPHPKLRAALEDCLGIWTALGVGKDLLGGLLRRHYEAAGLTEKHVAAIQALF